MEAELAQDTADVVADRSWAEEEPFGDLGVAQPVCKQTEHVALAVGQDRSSSEARRRGHSE